MAVEIRTAHDVARVVRDARHRRQTSQEALAAAAGVSRRWLIDLEAGKPRAELNLVLTVLQTLGVPLHAGAGSDDGSTSPARSVENVGDQPAGGVNLDAHLRQFLGHA